MIDKNDIKATQREEASRVTQPDPFKRIRDLAYEWREKFWAGQRTDGSKLNTEYLQGYHRGIQQELEECYEQLIRVVPDAPGPSLPTEPRTLAEEIVSTVFPSMDAACALRYVQQVEKLLNARPALPTEPTKDKEQV